MRMSHSSCVSQGGRREARASPTNGLADNRLNTVTISILHRSPDLSCLRMYLILVMLCNRILFRSELVSRSGSCRLRPYGTYTLNAITWAPECGYDDTSDRALLLAPAHSWPCGPSVISCASRLISLSEVDPRLDIDSSDKMLPLRHPEHKADLGQLLPSLPSNSAGWYKSGCEPSATTATR